MSGGGGGPTVEQARSLLELHRPAQAREVLHRVLAVDPHDATALCVLAQACLADEQGPAALEAASAAVQLAPDDEWPLRLAALAMARCHRRDEARVYAELAVGVDPSNWRTHLARAQVDLVTRSVGRPTVAAAEEAVRLAPLEAQPYRVLGNAHLALRHRAEAEAALREALRLAPDDAAARNDLARVHVLRRNLGRAAVGFADAAALDPSDPVAADNLTVVGAKALRVVHVVLWLVLFTAAGQGVQTSPPDRRLVGLGWTVAAVVLVGFAAHLWHGSRPRTFALLRVVARRDRLLDAWFGCLVGAFVLLGAAAVAPAGGTSTLVTLSFACVAAGTVLTWVRSIRLRRAVNRQTARPPGASVPR